MKKIITLSIIIFALIATVIALFLIRQRYPIVIESFPKFAPHPTPTPLSGVTGTLSVPTPTITEKSSINLPVPFTPQAPSANWDKIHNENCEEASSIMIATYFDVCTSCNKSSFNNGDYPAKLPAGMVEAELNRLTDWEMEHFGYNLDINSQETAEMIQKAYGLNTKVLSDYTLDDIKKELNQNHLVLIPENGQLIGNTNYKQPGPKYHMLVIRGYSGDSIITNDPGTRNGQNYIYDFKTLYDANGNWNHKTETVDLTQKNIIIIWQ